MLIAMNTVRVLLAIAWGAWACCLSGCVGSVVRSTDVSADLERRSGYSVPASEPGRSDLLPSTVSLEDGLSEDEAVTLALWNNASFQEALADLGLSRADLVQAGMLPNPTLSMLFPIGAKPLELTVKYPLETLLLRPRRVAAARLDHERTAQRLVQSGLDLIRDVRLIYADLELGTHRIAFAGAASELAALSAKRRVVLTPHPGEFRTLFPELASVRERYVGAVDGQCAWRILDVIARRLGDARVGTTVRGSNA